MNIKKLPLNKNFEIYKFLTTREIINSLVLIKLLGTQVIKYIFQIINSSDLSIGITKEKN